MPRTPGPPRRPHDGPSPGTAGSGGRTVNAIRLPAPLPPLDADRRPVLTGTWHSVPGGERLRRAARTALTAAGSDGS